MKFLLNEQFSLSNENIGEFCRKLSELYRKYNVVHTEAVTNPLYIEEVLLLYQAQNGIESKVSVTCCKSIAGIRLELRIAGAALNPLKKDDPDQEFIGMLLKKTDSTPEWNYRNNQNFITTKVNVRHRVSPMAALVLSMVFAVIAGVICRFTCKEAADAFATNYLQPIFDIVISLLTGCAAFFVFLSIVNGICNMGSITTFNRIGKKILLKYLAFLGMGTVLSSVVLVPFFKISADSQFHFEFSSFFTLILSMVPRNLAEPFITSNMLQIIFLSVAFGLIILSLGAKVHSVKEMLGQLESILSVLLNGITNFIPIVVAISIFQIVVSDNLGQLAGLYKLPLITALASVVLLLAALIQSFLKGMNVKALCRGNISVFLQAFMTASSAATLPIAMRVNEENFGMDPKVNHVGIPLGQVLFKPGAIVEFLASALCLAELFNVPMSIPWIITAAFLSFILSMAIPPIPNGLATVTTMLFTSLGIPLAGVALVIAADIINDRITTACGITVQQLELCQISSNQFKNQDS